jgi:hypothetical protein
VSGGTLASVSGPPTITSLAGVENTSLAAIAAGESPAVLAAASNATVRPPFSANECGPCGYGPQVSPMIPSGFQAWEGLIRETNRPYSQAVGNRILGCRYGGAVAAPFGLWTSF